MMPHGLGRCVHVAPLGVLRFAQGERLVLAKIDTLTSIVERLSVTVARMEGRPAGSSLNSARS
jgi:hypothetical protein